MKRYQIINAVQELCNKIETEIIGQESICVDCGAILTGDNIDDYSIESVSHIVDKEQIAISVRFHAIASNTWHGKFYFIDIDVSPEDNSEQPKTNPVGMTDLEIMHHRFSHKNFKKHTGLLAEMLGMSRKDYEDAVKRGMEQEAKERKRDSE